MFPNLFKATQEYWYKLDAVEKAYQNNELTLEQVNLEVAKLMKELGQQRREALRFFWQQLFYTINQSKELIIGLTFLVLLTYSWWCFNQI
ncbi:MAG: hypothetical protein AB4041_11330 [Microcystaceae cyanobacterium]